MKNRTAIVIGILMLGTALPGMAQVNLGVIGGLNIAGLNENVETWVPYNKTYFGFGGVVDIPINTTLSLVLQPMFVKKGGAAIDGPTHYEFARSYLELPLLLKVAVGSGVRPYAIAGPTFGYLLSSKVNGWSGADDLDGDMKDLTETFELGLCFGAGLSIEVGFGTIFIEGRYGLGLTNTNKGGTMDIQLGSTTSTGVMSDEDVLETRNIQVMAGVTVPVSK